MADFVFNIAKGQVAYLCGLPATNDALIVIPLEASGLEADATLKDYANVSTLLAGTTNEQTTLGRKTVTASVVVTPDNTNDWVTVDMPDLTWTASAGNAIGALLIAYDNDTTGGTDANLIPLVCLVCAMTPDGSDFTAVINAAGFYKAS
jgi:hypothetical protein